MTYKKTGKLSEAHNIDGEYSGLTAKIKDKYISSVNSIYELTIKMNCSE